MPKLSSGLLLFRRVDQLEVLLVHMGGPFWRGREQGAWSLPKGEHLAGEDSLEQARREFAEELGHPAPEGVAIDLGSIRQRGGKVVRAWAQEGDLDVGDVVSNTFELEWPRRSGKLARFPEVDRAEWFDLDSAREKLVAGQVPLLERLLQRVAASSPEA
jgi:predicted NUDIX family NTP pyrophosphohydrolase